MQNIDLIITTTDDQSIAYNIAQDLVIENLAACTQIDEVISFYKWEGQLEQQKEFRIMIKAKNIHYTKIEKKILALHNYSTPQIIRLKIDGGLEKYLNWINT